MFLRLRLVAVLRSLPILYHSADYIFLSFGIIELMLVCFEYTVLLKPWLGGVKDVALQSISNRLTKTESGIFLSCMISLLLKGVLFKIY